jgi:hypothetical protein
MMIPLSQGFKCVGLMSADVLIDRLASTIHLTVGLFGGLSQAVCPDVWG